MLTGHLRVTQGSAHLAGFDVARDSDKLSRVVGLCPQFSNLWDDLTVQVRLSGGDVNGCSLCDSRSPSPFHPPTDWLQEHLLFFARSVGVPKSRLRAEVQHTAEKVGLDGDAFLMQAK